jgi:hypothetical protein
LEQTVTLARHFVKSNGEDPVQLLSCVPLAAAKPGVASVKLGPIPTFWEFDFSAKYYPNGASAIKRTLTDELEKSGFVIYGSISRSSGPLSGSNWIVRHKSKRQMSLFMLKNSEISMKVYDFYFNIRGSGRVNVY